MAIEIPIIKARLWALLPKGWFSENAPNLMAVLASFATSWSWLTEIIDFTGQQARLATASDIWLDFAACDYLGHAFARIPGERDDAFRARINARLLLGTGTRPALIAGISKLTGFSASVFEPSRCADTGAYGAATSSGGVAPCAFAYGQSGGWGSLNLPNQIFITISTDPRPGDAQPSGYGDAAGGYSGGSTFYNTLGSIQSQVTDSAIMQVVRQLLPVNCIAWLRIN